LMRIKCFRHLMEQEFLFVKGWLRMY
jgi:hypothetical protein